MNYQTEQQDRIEAGKAAGLYVWGFNDSKHDDVKREYIDNWKVLCEHKKNFEGWCTNAPLLGMCAAPKDLDAFKKNPALIFKEEINKNRIELISTPEKPEPKRQKKENQNQITEQK
jgi:hypothetical protein